MWNTRRNGRSAPRKGSGWSAVYTGLRRGDAVRRRRQHEREGIATLRTEKTGAVVMMPILPVLAETTEAGSCGDLTFIAGDRRQPLTNKQTPHPDGRCRLRAKKVRRLKYLSSAWCGQRCETSKAIQGISQRCGRKAHFEVQGIFSRHPAPSPGKRIVAANSAASRWQGQGSSASPSSSVS